MTDSEREAHIKDLGDQLMQAYAQWEATGCFSAKGEVIALRERMEAAIASRSPAQVASMELARGLN